MKKICNFKLLKIGMQIKVIAGRFKGQIGRISRLFGDKVYVASFKKRNCFEKFREPTDEKTGEIGEIKFKLKAKPISIHRSNVQAVYDLKNKLSSRIGIAMDNNEKVVIFKKNRKILYRFKKNSQKQKMKSTKK